MIKKPAVLNETAVPARKAAAPRVKQAKHRAVTPVVTEEPQQDVQESVEKIAYGYWEARGFTDGDPMEDWLRAEAEVRNKTVSNRTN